MPLKFGTIGLISSSSTAGKISAAKRGSVFLRRRGDIVDDYWIENGAKLSGIDTDLSSSTPAIEIMLEGYTHVATNPKSFKVYYSQDGGEEGIDLCDGEGCTTVLRFESRRMIPAYILQIGRRRGLLDDRYEQLSETN